jgi:hypothetical protein
MFNKRNISMIFVPMFCMVFVTVTMESDTQVLITSLPADIIGNHIIKLSSDNPDRLKEDLFSYKYKRVMTGMTGLENPSAIVEEIQMFFRCKQACRAMYTYFKFPWAKWSAEKKNNVREMVMLLCGPFDSDYKAHRVLSLACVYSGADIKESLTRAITCKHTSDVKWLVDYQQNIFKKTVDFHHSYCNENLDIALILCKAKRSNADQIELFGEDVYKQLCSKDSTQKEREQLIIDSIRKQCVSESLCIYHDNQEGYYNAFYRGYHDLRFH